VDCLSRMFMFDEAQKLIDNYELSHPPCVVMYSKYFDDLLFHPSWASTDFFEYEYEYEYSKNRTPNREFRIRLLRNMCSTPLQCNYRVYTGALLHTIESRKKN
jgi:hypothetical protein